MTQGSKAQPWTVSQNSFQQQYTQCYISVPPTLPVEDTPSHPMSHDSDTADQCTGSEGTQLKKTQKAATCQFFGFLKETLYQNTVIADMLGYKFWCLLCICRRGECQVSPEITDCKQSTLNIWVLSECWIATTTQQSFTIRANWKFPILSHSGAKRKKPAHKREEILTIKYTTWAYSAKCCFSTGSTHSLPH